MADETEKIDPTSGNQPQIDTSLGFPEPVILEERIIAPAPKAPVASSPAAPLTGIVTPPPKQSFFAKILDRSQSVHSPAPEPIPTTGVPQPVAKIERMPTHLDPGPIVPMALPQTPIAPKAPSPSEEVGLWKPSAAQPQVSAPKPRPVSTVVNVMPRSASEVSAALTQLTSVPKVAPPQPIPTQAPQPPAPTAPTAPPAPPAPSASVATFLSVASTKPKPAIPEAPPEDRNDITKFLQEVKLPERRDERGSADPKPRIIENKPILSEPEPLAPRASPSAPAKKAPEIITPVHTLKDDLQEVVRDKKISIVRAAALEEDKRRGQEHFSLEHEEALRKRKRRTRALLFSAGLLFVLGGLALAGVFYVESQRSSLASPVQSSSILFSEQSVAFPITTQSPRDLKDLLARARSASAGSLGSITRIVPTTAQANADGTTTQVPLSLSQFFTALGINPPDELMRAIGPDFFFGIHTVDKNAPIFVIPVTSYDHAFSGMLQWEGTMNVDLSPIFTAVPALTTGSDGLPVARTFQDGILQNYDVRELKNDQGNVELYYSFPTPNLLVIAESTYSFTEILSRLQAERKL